MLGESHTTTASTSGSRVGPRRASMTLDMDAPPLLGRGVRYTRVGTQWLQAAVLVRPHAIEALRPVCELPEDVTTGGLHEPTGVRGVEVAGVVGVLFAQNQDDEPEVFRSASDDDREVA